MPTRDRSQPTVELPLATGERAALAMDGICFVEPDGEGGYVIREVNARFAHLLGVERASARGRPLAELGAEPAALFAAIRAGASGDQLEARRGSWRRADGSVLSARFSVASVEVAGELLICLAVRDPRAPTEVPARLGRRVERATRQQAALIGLAELTDVTFAEQLRQILRVDAYTLDVARVGFWSLEEHLGLLRCDARFVKSDNAYREGEQLATDALTHPLAVLGRGTVLACDDVADEEDVAELARLLASGDVAQGERGGAGALLGAPVHLRGALIGVVIHEHVGASRRWNVDEQLFAMSIGQILALAVEGRHRRKVERALRESEARFRAIVEASPVPMLVTRTDGTCLYGNRAASETLGLPPDELLRRRAPDLYADPADRAPLLERVAEQGGVRGEEVLFRRQDDGSPFWASLSVQPAAFAGQPALVVGFVDVTERKRMEQTLRHMALHDTLTGLPNRAMFYDLLRREIAHAGREPGYGFAVLFIDLDDFKQVNDRFGHEAGDTLLVSIASRLRSCLRPHDSVGRIGGDEFAVLLTEISQRAEAVAIAERITAVVRVPHHLGGDTADPSVSIGVVLNAERYDDPDRMLRDADQAMYRAKELGKSRYQIFDGPAPDADQ